MAFAENEAVIVRVFGMVQVVSEGAAKEQPGHQFRCGKGGCRMPGTRFSGHGKRVISNQIAYFL